MDMEIKCEYITWDESFSLKNINVDKQHEMLFQIVNDSLHITDKYRNETNTIQDQKYLNDSTKQIFHYMKTHFAEEEKFMKEIHFPLLKEHKQAHINLISQAKRVLNYANNPRFFARVIEGLMKNFIKHFIQYDLLINNFMNKALHINEINFNLDHYTMLRSLEHKEIYNEETYNYICRCQLSLIHKIPKSIHEELNDKEQLIKCPNCNNILVYVGKVNLKEDYEKLRKQFLTIENGGG